MSCLHQRGAEIPRSRACAALGLARTGTYPRPARTRSSGAVRRPQPHALSDAEIEGVLEVINDDAHQDQTVRVIHARNVNQGQPMPSVSTIYRILRRRGQTRERRAQRPPRRYSKPRVLASAPNAGWSWDISKLATTTKGRYLNLYQILDLFSRYPIAWMISRKENAALARHLFEDALSAYAIEPGQLVVHQDRGAPMIAHRTRDFLDARGVRRSYSRPRVSNDNPFSEAYFKTVKYSPGYPGRFEGLDHACRWMREFVPRYKNTPHDGLALYTPSDVFYGRVEAVHAQRQAALDAYFGEHPERFRHGRPVAARPPTQVAINPDDSIAADSDDSRPIIESATLDGN